MNYSDFRFTLDIQIHQAQVSVPVTFGDSARRLCIGLTDGRKSYVIGEGCRAVFNAKKPDGKVIKNDCIIERNVILYEFTEQTANSEGIVYCDITLYDTDGKVLTSPQFTIVVDKRVVRDEEVAISADEYTALDNIFKYEAQRQKAETLRQTTFEESEAERAETFFLSQSDREFAFSTAQSDKESRFATAETERQKTFGESETYRTMLEERRQEAENARVEAENVRIEAETARDTAEKARNTAEDSRVIAEIGAKGNWYDEREGCVRDAEGNIVPNENAGRVGADLERELHSLQARVHERLREQSEEKRIENETDRRNYEGLRRRQEEERIANEEERIEKDAERDGKIAKIEGFCQDFVEGKQVVKSAENAVDAINAEYAESADFAEAADYATKARADYNGNVIHETYVMKDANGDIPLKDDETWITERKEVAVSAFAVKSYIDDLSPVEPSPGLVVRRDEECDVALPVQAWDFVSYGMHYAVSGHAVKEYLDKVVGDTETALDAILAIQNTLIGGDA